MDKESDEMDKKIINLNQTKKEKYVEKELANIGLDEETVKEYKEALKYKTTETLTEFFIKREKISKEVNDWVKSRFKTMADMTMFLSIITEHLQNLIVPDSEHFYDLAFDFSEESQLEFDHWINVQGELEKFHLSSMATYVKEMRDGKY